MMDSSLRLKELVSSRTNPWELSRFIDIGIAQSVGLDSPGLPESVYVLTSKHINGSKTGPAAVLDRQTDTHLEFSF